MNGTYQVSPQKARLDSAQAAYDVAQANCHLAKGHLNDGLVTAAQATANLDQLLSPDDATLAAAQALPGQAVEITLDGIPDARLTGHVTCIDPAGDLVQGVINDTVQIKLDPTTAPLRLDMTTNARIIQASHTDGATGQTYVEVVDQPGPQQNTRRVDVMLGLTTGTQVEVAGELSTSEHVTLSATPRRTTGFPGRP